MNGLLEMGPSSLGGLADERDAFGCWPISKLHSDVSLPDVFRGMRLHPRPLFIVAGFLSGIAWSIGCLVIKAKIPTYATSFPLKLVSQ
ncbi:hypothetical protein [Agrobacterium vitis]|uniref:hypothetical protein n=1 Tax=Agrobacterium vitis TaxID=373 RepID=UPI0012E91039|nr:hypothetical protein [Agrobacterium vitis]MVA35227.1 hypothetical protein [Agrobacterium vitis]